APSNASTGPKANIVDACVNANVAALMAFMNARHLPGYGEAIATVVEAIRWAGSDPRRLSAITPFYPTLQGLADAGQHAVDCGVSALGNAADRLATLIATKSSTHGDEELCCRSAYGTTIWRCEAVAVARALGSRRAHELRGDSRVAHRIA